MRIAVNTRLLLKNRLEGIGWFTYETMKRITRRHPEHEFIFLFDREYDSEFIFSDNVTPVVLRPQSRHPFLWYIWFEHSVRRFIEKNNINLFISTDGHISLSTKVKQIDVIHDINFFHFPESLPYLVRSYYNYFFPRFAKKANRLATVSTYSKEDICLSYGIDSDKIDVVYNGANDLYHPLSEIEKHETRLKITGGLPYFVFVGAFNPRKNIARLLLAFDLFKKQIPSNIKLVIVGEKMHETSDMVDALNKMIFRKDVVFTGRLQVEELKNLIGSALAMTYVSYFEGFGIPILEAMSCDVPIVASNCTSIPEVAGNAAIYVDPFSIESIAAGMTRIYTEDDLRSKLIVNARKQCEKFSWDKTAELLYKCIEKEIS